MKKSETDKINTENLTPLRHGFVFAGCFIGAGYISGQELWQYFGGLKEYCIPGLLLTLLLLFAAGCLIMLLSRRLGTDEADKIMVPWNIPILRRLCVILEGLELFAVIAIMTAGTGALLNMLTGLPHFVGCGIFSILVLITALRGMEGLISAFSLIIPPLTVCTVLIGLLSVSRWGIVPFRTVETANTLKMPFGWIGNAVNYMCYNIFGAVIILASLASGFPEGKSAERRMISGNAAGIAGMALIAFSILFSIASCSGSDEAELPMLYAAEALSPWAGRIYAVLLCGAMFGAALSSTVGLMHFYSEKISFIRSHSRLSLYVLIAAAFAASLTGFGDLISFIYPVFGYASGIFILFMIICFLKKRKP